MHGRLSSSCIVSLLLALIASAPGLLGAEQPKEAPAGDRQGNAADTWADAAVLKAKIAPPTAKPWNQNKVEPAPGADDADFLGRTSLNLAGKIPPVYDARKFLAD